LREALLARGKRSSSRPGSAARRRCIPACRPARTENPASINATKPSGQGHHPRKPDASALVERIFAVEASELMPPRKTLKVLSAVQKETLKRWVAEGAEYQPHWSFLAAKRPCRPRSRTRMGAQSDRPIHPRRAGEEGIEPAPEADCELLPAGSVLT